MNSRVIRVKPKSFFHDWQKDFLDFGCKLPENLSIQQYTPINHRPTPFSVEVDLPTRTVVKKIVGVMPNATYKGHIYSWNEFVSLIRPDGENGDGK